MCWVRLRCIARKQRGPYPEETRLTQIATHIAGIAIERQRAQETLREREARINLAAESADLAFWVIYPEAKHRLDERQGTKDLRLRLRSSH